MKILTKPQVWKKNDPRMPIGAVYVGRPTKFGNPYSHKPSNVFHVIRVATLQDALREYRQWLMLDAQRQLREEIHKELRGKHLCCWCAPDPCHAEILLELANESRAYEE